MFYSINASVVEAITVAQAGGGEMIVAAAFFDANNKQTKPKGAVQRKGRGEEGRGGGDRKDGSREDETGRADEDGDGPWAMAAAVKGRGSIHPCIRMSACCRGLAGSLSSLFPDWNHC
jgi:hypothetical protein